jgi:hypothetical protein
MGNDFFSATSGWWWGTLPLGLFSLAPALQAGDHDRSLNLLNRFNGLRLETVKTVNWRMVVGT